jgi:PAS domain S-box-containing protein/putative nucleotidyltransferase with HDIG domain
MFGYTMEEIKGQSIETLVYPDDIPMVRRYHRGRVRGKNVPSKYECRGMRKDGSTISIEVNAVPLRENGGIVGTRSYIWDITDRKQAEEEKQNIYEKLRKALEETVNALSSAVETRDPYTAGHQQRVANLASAIARAMNLSEAQVEGIRMAGVVHDVGKIRVPAEILSKPGAIDEIDFSIIKSHPQIGFNILRKIEFPYLVGQIILQHHERLNGSGYPVGLSGEKILLEARILAVADVVEAMASHRPYRPALGVGKALKEISRNKGVLYDPKVVDSCLKLFQKKKFRFS